MGRWHARTRTKRQQLPSQASIDAGRGLHAGEWPTEATPLRCGGLRARQSSRPIRREPSRRQFPSQASTDADRPVGAGSGSQPGRALSGWSRAGTRANRPEWKVAAVRWGLITAASLRSKWTGFIRQRIPRHRSFVGQRRVHRGTAAVAVRSDFLLRGGRHDLLHGLHPSGADAPHGGGGERGERRNLPAPTAGVKSKECQRAVVGPQSVTPHRSTQPQE